MDEKTIMEKMASGKIKNSFVIPDAKYLGDTFFILDTKGKVIALFAWDGGGGWFRDDTTFHVQEKAPTEYENIPMTIAPAGFKHVKYPQPKQTPLTDEILDDIWAIVLGQSSKGLKELRGAYARAIEKAHGIGEKE
jgi:hypothetical protein